MISTSSPEYPNAPFAGLMLQVTTAPGENITPERVLFTVADLSRVWLIGGRLPEDIAKVRVGQNAVVTIDTYPGAAFTGRITNTSDTLDPTTRTAEVRCEVQNRDGRLSFRVFTTLELPVSATHDALMVPARSIQDIDGVPTVFVRLGEERFQPRPVRIGASVGTKWDRQLSLAGRRPGHLRRTHAQVKAEAAC